MKDRRSSSQAGSARHRLGRRSFLGASLGAVAGGITARSEPVAAQPAAVGAGTGAFFPGFQRRTVEANGTTVHFVVGGSGPPVLLLHGYPTTHLMWRQVAPELAKHFTVVASDLRGYGDSGRPPDGENHFGHSKRAMAQDQVEVMEKLGFRTFALAGHDRGGRVAHRMALDHPDRVSKLVVMDILPSYETFQKVDRKFATNNWYWFFLLEPTPFPETLIGNSLDTYLKKSVGHLMPDRITPEIYAEYFRCFNNPASIHAYCEDYRAGATIDLEHDAADLNRKVACPTFVLWGGSSFRGQNYDPIAVWRDRAVEVSGKGITGTHHFVEESPAETVAELGRIFST